ncbi:MAG: hypothetical protein MUF87_05020 [Anaerolineae bacterium]|jgi:hypothetical protein|nr:hypothetical protein [Anaerolineae bacterium]
MFPQSIRAINALADDEKRKIYSLLLPEWLGTSYGIDLQTLTRNGLPAVFFRYVPGSRAVEISVKRHPADIDPILYLHMADTFNHQLIVLLTVVNDPDAPRFNTDVDVHGMPTHFGTSGRNLFAEQAAMEAGLAPGQVRAGLRVFKQSVPIFEQFVEKMGYDLFLIEPLAYHNAIIFERYGFSYLRGHSEMQRIHREFQPGGTLYRKLTPENVFRQPDAYQTIRRRSWAIHDGILGHPFTGFQMYKRIGTHANINTFPDAKW